MAFPMPPANRRALVVSEEVSNPITFPVNIGSVDYVVVQQDVRHIIETKYTKFINVSGGGPSNEEVMVNNMNLLQNIINHLSDTKQKIPVTLNYNFNMNNFNNNSQWMQLDCDMKESVINPFANLFNLNNESTTSKSTNFDCRCGAFSSEDRSDEKEDIDFVDIEEEECIKGFSKT